MKEVTAELSVGGGGEKKRGKGEGKEKEKRGEGKGKELKHHHHYLHTANSINNVKSRLIVKTKSKLIANNNKRIET